MRKNHQTTKPPLEALEALEALPPTTASHRQPARSHTETSGPHAGAQRGGSEADQGTAPHPTEALGALQPTRAPEA